MAGDNERFGHGGDMMTKRAQRILDRIRGRRTLAGEALPDGLVLPAYDGYSLATVLAHFGVPGPPTAPLAPDVIGDELSGVKKFVILLVDALGYLAVSSQMARDRGLALNGLARRGRFAPLATVFPSTTSVTLATLRSLRPCTTARVPTSSCSLI